MTTTSFTHRRSPLIFKLLILFLFFLPLRSIDLPSINFGLGIGFTRLFILLALVGIFMSSCIDPWYFKKIFYGGPYRNPFVLLLLVFFAFSILYYYVSLFMGETVLFGSGDFFFRSWKGRPIGQFVSFLTYGIIPFFLVQHYSQYSYLRKKIERTVVIVTLLLVYYGYIQMISFYLGLPVTTQVWYDTTAVPMFLGLERAIIRFYSLAGEPRDFGAFIIGALFFYIYFIATYKGYFSRFAKFNIILLCIAFLLTFSTSSYLIAISALLVIFFDAVFCKRIHIRRRHVQFVLIVGLVVMILFRLAPQILELITIRSRTHNREFYSRTGVDVGDTPYTGQAVDFVVIPYLANINRITPLYFLLGSGYGNFLNPMIVDILKERYNWDVIRRTTFTDTRSTLIKIFVEGGIMGVALYCMVFFYTLRLNNILLSLHRNAGNMREYRQVLLLRYAFIVFFVSDAIQISFHYFIMMALIIGILNGLVRERRSPPSLSITSTIS